jgi:copper(I)-binding protein
MSHFFTKPAVSAMLMMVVLLAASCADKSDGPHVLLEDGWVRAMPPASGMTAAYGRFTYQGATTIEITSFRSDAYADVSLHESVKENGISRMQPAVWSQAPGTTKVLEPGGYHLMLMHPSQEIHPGDIVGLTLVANDGREFSFSLPVETR